MSGAIIGSRCWTPTKLRPQLWVLVPLTFCMVNWSSVGFLYGLVQTLKPSVCSLTSSLLCIVYVAYYISRLPNNLYLKVGEGCFSWNFSAASLLLCVCSPSIRVRESISIQFSCLGSNLWLSPSAPVPFCHQALARLDSWTLGPSPSGRLAVYVLQGLL